MTTEPRTELWAEPGQAWLRARRAPASPAGPALEAAPYGRHRRAPEQRSSYREVFAIAEFRALWTAQVLSFAGAPFSSARAALLPDVLPGDKFVLGSAIGNISFQASQILGFVAGAAVVAVVDPYWTMSLDAVSFGISALSLRRE